MRSRLPNFIPLKALGLCAISALAVAAQIAPAYGQSATMSDQPVTLNEPSLTTQEIAGVLATSLSIRGHIVPGSDHENAGFGHSVVIHDLLDALDAQPQCHDEQFSLRFENIIDTKGVRSSVAVPQLDHYCHTLMQLSQPVYELDR